MNILTWTGAGMLSNGMIAVDLLTKPHVGFAFDTLYYEEPTGHFQKTLGGRQQELSSQERDACLAYIAAFLEREDYLVQACAPENDLWMGTMLKSQALDQDLIPVLAPAPEFPVARLKDGTWEEIVAVVTQGGRLRLRPDSPHPAFVLHLTAEEWQDFPKPCHAADTWDFRTGTWQDKRSLESVQAEAQSALRLMFARRAREEEAVAAAVPAWELSTWSLQREEALAWQKDSTAATPFLDAILEENPDLSKAWLVERILQHYEAEARTRQGRVHGKLYKALRTVRALNSNAAIDGFMRDVAARENSRGNYAVHGWNPPFQNSIASQGNGAG